MSGMFPFTISRNPKFMKIIRKTRDGGHREELLREYRLSAPLIALLKKVGEGVARSVPTREMAVIPVRIRR